MSPDGGSFSGSSFSGSSLPDDTDPLNPDLPIEGRSIEDALDSFPEDDFISEGSNQDMTAPDGDSFGYPTAAELSPPPPPAPQADLPQTNTTGPVTGEVKIAATGEEDRFKLLKGSVLRVTYRSDDTGFGVMRAEASGTDLRDTSVTVVGVLPSTLNSGTNFIARGEWRTHPKFGRQFNARSITETAPTSKEAIVRYLGSGVIKGFGPKLAERVVQQFGEESISILDNEPERLLEVPGIGGKKLQELKAAWDEKKNLREVMLFFQNHGVSLALAQRIYRSYRERAIEVVKQNPYILSRDVWGIGFLTADKIAQAFGIEPTALVRIIAGLVHTLKRASDDGHCFLPREQLLAKAASLLEVGDESLVVDGLAMAALQGELVVDGESIYLPLILQAETELARSIKARIERLIPALDIGEPLIMDTIRGGITTGEDDTGTVRIVHLSDQQQQTLRQAATRTLTVITGGPGCGKTTVVRAISRLFRRAGLQTKLAAPTGRAAQRLAEVCDMKASTIHRLLKYDPVNRSFLHDDRTPLPLDAIIIDESSMIDVQLAASLFRAIPVTARIVVVGDADQLPSVGPGLFLADLLQIETVPRIRLTQLFRRSAESSINGIAHDINAGVVPQIPEPDGKVKCDAYFLPVREPHEAAEMIERLVVDQIPRKFGFSGSQITVLTPMNQGEIGTISLNQRLQQRLIPADSGFPSVKTAAIEFRLGDRVCQRVNNYNLHANGVFNGDQGEVIGIDAEARKVIVKLWDQRQIEYPSEDLYQLDLAYALTIHRSQGSEVPVVVLLLHESHNILLERQLVYTAVTRAKKLLIVVGTKKALHMAVKRSRSRKRFTALAERVIGAAVRYVPDSLSREQV